MKTLLISAALIAAASVAGATDARMLRAWDVAEDHTRFAFQAEPVDADGMPRHGNPFVTRGYVYPLGTLGEGESGVNPDGTPAYPELVLGDWTCDGFLIDEAMATTTGPFLISRQTIVLNDGAILITQGPEIVDIGVPQIRAVTGSTGTFRGNDGDVHQTFLGWSEDMGLRARFVLAAPRFDRDEDLHEIEAD
ncbi:hypothetical protein MWU52_10770 [Jannaschia sp. S6380]|uniref:hypothetical protein n=1 Tax=Jannaschia sp. S6380 TaxID=2926408 RepID=UPI001FF1756E|nr:hypothetical protein [Jannaschia sp. S6380]MCK0168034.1 hypothetical protein [Jannaschia sp. S6380]